MMHALYMLRYAKRHILGRNNVEQRKSQACNHSCYLVMLASGSQSVENSNKKFLLLESINLLEAFRVELKALLGLVIPAKVYCKAGF